MTSLTSLNGTLTFGKGHPTMLINDQLHVIDYKTALYFFIHFFKQRVKKQKQRQSRKIDLEQQTPLIPSQLLMHNMLKQREKHAFFKKNYTWRN